MGGVSEGVSRGLQGFINNNRDFNVLAPGKRNPSMSL